MPNGGCETCLYYTMPDDPESSYPICDWAAYTNVRLPIWISYEETMTEPWEKCPAWEKRLNEKTT